MGLSKQLHLGPFVLFLILDWVKRFNKRCHIAWFEHFNTAKTFKNEEFWSVPQDVAVGRSWAHLPFPQQSTTFGIPIKGNLKTGWTELPQWGADGDVEEAEIRSHKGKRHTKAWHSMVFCQSSERLKLHITHLSHWILHGRDKPPKRLALNTNREYVQENCRIVQKGRPAVKEMNLLILKHLPVMQEVAGSLPRDWDPGSRPLWILLVYC